jgi:hypothetical protein
MLHHRRISPKGGGRYGKSLRCSISAMMHRIRPAYNCQDVVSAKRSTTRKNLSFAGCAEDASGKAITEGMCTWCGSLESFIPSEGTRRRA